MSSETSEILSFMSPTFPQLCEPQAQFRWARVVQDYPIFRPIVGKHIIVPGICSWPKYRDTPVLTIGKSRFVTAIRDTKDMNSCPCGACKQFGLAVFVVDMRNESIVMGVLGHDA